MHLFAATLSTASGAPECCAPPRLVTTGLESQLRAIEKGKFCRDIFEVNGNNTVLTGELGSKN